MGKPFLYDTILPCLVVISRDNSIHITFSQHTNKHKEGKKVFLSKQQQQWTTTTTKASEIHVGGIAQEEKWKKYTPQFEFE